MNKQETISILQIYFPVTTDGHRIEVPVGYIRNLG